MYIKVYCPSLQFKILSIKIFYYPGIKATMKAHLLGIMLSFSTPAWLSAQIDSTLQTIELNQQQPEILVSPSLSANLIGKNQWEVNLFNTLTARDIENTRITRNPVDNTNDTTITKTQYTRLDHILQIQYGLPRHPRLNVGLDLYATHLRADTNVHSSPFRVLGNSTEGGMSRREVTALGPRVRWMPFRKIPELTVQGSVVFGLSGDLTTRQIYGRDRTQLLTQITFYQRFQPWLYAFVQMDVSVFLKNNDFQNNTFSIPLFLYASANIWGLRSNVYPKVYGLFSWFYASRYDDHIRNEAWLRKTSYESQVGIGLLSQLNPRWGITIWTQKPIAYDLGSASNKIIAGSWYSVSLGVRYRWIPKSSLQ